MATSRLHGKNGAIYIDGTKVTTKNAWSLNLGRDYADITVFGDDNKMYLGGLRDVSGSFEGLLDVSGDLMVSMADGKSHLIALYASDGTNGSETHLVGSGLGLIDCAVSVNVSDAVRCSGSFRASGVWTVMGS